MTEGDWAVLVTDTMGQKTAKLVKIGVGNRTIEVDGVRFEASTGYCLDDEGYELRRRLIPLGEQPDLN